MLRRCRKPDLLEVLRAALLGGIHLEECKDFGSNFLSDEAMPRIIQMNSIFSNQLGGILGQGE